MRVALLRNIINIDALMIGVITYLSIVHEWNFFIHVVFCFVLFFALAYDVPLNEYSHNAPLPSVMYMCVFHLSVTVIHLL